MSRKGELVQFRRCDGVEGRKGLLGVDQVVAIHEHRLNGLVQRRVTGW
jgi:hypothetical protein